MAITRVRSYITLKARVCKDVDKTNPQTRQGVEDHEEQWVQKHDCRPINMDYNDWRWRWEKAIDILCGGSVQTTGTYTGDAVGGYFV